MRTLIACILLVGFPGWSARIAAQDASATITGRVTDTAGVALSGAEVTAAHLQARARSDTGGHFRLAGLPAAQRIVVTVRRFGYHSFTTAVTLTRGETRDIAVRLAVLPVPLDTMVSEAQATSENLRRNGFYQRQRMGFGDFLTRDDLARMRAIDLWDVLERMPFLEVVRTPVRRPLVRVAGGTCRPSIYMDGLRVPDAEGIPVTLIDGIEFYRRASEIPVEFNTSGRACAALLLWTR